MKKSASSLLIVGCGALAHSVLLYGCAILAFVGSFGAPQGGDAVKKGSSHPEVVPFLTRFFDAGVAILSWPASMFTKGMRPLHLVWTLNSAAWGFFILLTVLLLRRMANQPPEPTSPFGRRGSS
jgi:hypothetical protein